MANELPFLSVIIPAYNRPIELEECLESLGRADYPKNRFEVIVVDDGSPAGLERAVRPYMDSLDLTFVRQRNAGASNASNNGAGLAKGELLAFTDDDCTVDPGWLRALVAAAATHPGAIIGGRVDNALPENIYSSASQLLCSYLYGRSFSGGAQGKSAFFTSNNLAVSRSFFLALGGFDEKMRTSEDRDFCARAASAGSRLAYAPGAIVRHWRRMGFCGFCRQHFNYGKGAFHFLKKRRGLPGGGLWPHSLSFYAGMAAFPFSVRPRHRGASVSFLLLLSQALYLAGLLWELILVGIWQRSSR